MTRRLPALTSTLAVASTIFVTALGFSSSPAAGAAPALAEEASGQLLVILDVSGSMERKDASGTTLMAGAREAVRDFVGSVPGEVEVGLRLYGSEYAGDAKAPGCRDTELAVPIAPASESGDEIVAAVEQARPTGFTPIGHSLTQAADDFSAEGERSIVLVSDGEDTCGDPTPCKAAKQLARDGIEVRVDTVGLFLQDNAAARKQLECIADATGGTYVPADDTAALTEQLSAVSSRAISRFQAAGEEVDGGPSQVQATPVEPGTTYVDDIVNGEARWYSIDLEVGQSIAVTATDDGTAEYGCCLAYELNKPDGSRLDRWGHYSEGTATTALVDSPLEDGVSEAGTYFFAAILDDTTSDEEYGAVEYQFTVEVTDVAMPTETATPSDTASATPTETPSNGGSEAADAAASDAEDGVPVVLWVVVGVLALAVLGLGALVLVLLRRMNASRP
ncbi:VWA domain-containing protein [Nocardioides seonyuensis]|uniref:VWA domain-containing protein n=1 Tax=Nocardioides seonyuensis TaxID=2518371 RepID=A0A4P7IJJ9_9ACTN|nr:VWA domain-containing protein [Nocardioides seonyuensis]QBX56061.1 VWA domain-containing protein [Nocardioides seonyuensis]